MTSGRLAVDPDYAKASANLLVVARQARRDIGA